MAVRKPVFSSTVHSVTSCHACGWQLVWANQGYTGAFAHWLNEQRGSLLEVVHHAERHLWRYGLEERPKHTFRVLPRRWAGAAWAGERTCACLGQSRRLSKDYERLPSTSEAMIYGAMSRLMLRRLARAAAVSQHPGSVGDW